MRRPRTPQAFRKHLPSKRAIRLRYTHARQAVGCHQRCNSPVAAVRLLPGRSTSRLATTRKDYSRERNRSSGRNGDHFKDSVRPPDSFRFPARRTAGRPACASADVDRSMYFAAERKIVLRAICQLRRREPILHTIHRGPRRQRMTCSHQSPRRRPSRWISWATSR